MRRAVLLLAATLLSGCGMFGKGEVYPIAGRDVRNTLGSTEPPMGVLGSQAVNWRVSRNGDGTVNWLVLDENGTELVRFWAKSTDEGPASTRVEVGLDPPHGKHHDRVAKGMESHAAIVDFYETAMTEQVDSALEKRPFEFTRIAGAMGGAMVSSMAEVSNGLDEAVAESQKRDKDNMDRAYREQRRGSFADETDADAREFGEPMDDGQ